jgi:uncharacterized protein YprB with RNaseH-like and TPR domain
MKILFLDIETAPNLVHVWGLWQQNVGLPQILDSGYVMCWAAKWFDEDEVMFDSILHNKPKAMLKRIHSLLDKADAVVHYHGSKFDIPTLNKEFIVHGLPPPAPYKQIDLLKTARSQFKFPSNKLDYIAQALKLGKKVKHRGHELWIECMNKDPVAWLEMEEYNIQDVILLEKVYKILLPWIKNHPNRGLYNPLSGKICPNCGNEHFNKRGFSYTSTCKYQRYQCKGCGAWFRGNENVGHKKGEKFNNV